MEREKRKEGSACVQFSLTDHGELRRLRMQRLISLPQHGEHFWHFGIMGHCVEENEGLWIYSFLMVTKKSQGTMPRPCTRYGPNSDTIQGQQFCRGDDKIQDCIHRDVLVQSWILSSLYASTAVS